MQNISSSLVLCKQEPDSARLSEEEQLTTCLSVLILFLNGIVTVKLSYVGIGSVAAGQEFQAGREGPCASESDSSEVHTQ
jgi:hypothetical protein